MIEPVKVTKHFFKPTVEKHYMLDDGSKVKIFFDKSGRVVRWVRPDAENRIKYYSVTNWKIRDSFLKTEDNLIRKSVSEPMFTKHNSRKFKITKLDFVGNVWSQKVSALDGTLIKFLILKPDEAEKIAKSMAKSFKKAF